MINDINILDSLLKYQETKKQIDTYIKINEIEKMQNDTRRPRYDRIEISQKEERTEPSALEDIQSLYNIVETLVETVDNLSIVLEKLIVKFESMTKCMDET